MHFRNSILSGNSFTFFLSEFIEYLVNFVYSQDLSRQESRVKREDARVGTGDVFLYSAMPGDTIVRILRSVADIVENLDEQNRT